MMKIRIIIPSLTALILACDPVQNLEVANKSSDTLFFELSHNRKFEVLPIQKGTSGDTLWSNMNFVLPRDSIKLPVIGTTGWKDFINKKCDDSTLTVFFFRKALLKSVTPESLVLEQLYSKKYSYRVKDLERLNWRVEYRE